MHAHTLVPGAFVAAHLRRGHKYARPFLRALFLLPPCSLNYSTSDLSKRPLPVCVIIQKQLLPWQLQQTYQVRNLAVRHSDSLL